MPSRTPPRYLVPVVVLAMLIATPLTATAQDRRPDRFRDLMHLRCAPVEADQPVIGCRWTPGPEGTARYVVLRADRFHDRVTVVARLGPDAQGVRDAEVRVGVRYTYLVRAETEDGRQISHTNRATTGIRAGHDARR